MRTLELLTIAAIACTAAIAHADGTTRIAVFDSARLYEPGGIARWLDARKKLDVERKAFVVVESPDGKTVADESIELCRAPSDDARAICQELADARRMRTEDAAWAEHEAEVLDPIAADVTRALERYARVHGIDLVLDRGKLGEMLLVVSASADITTAFIKDYNAASKPRAR